MCLNLNDYKFKTSTCNYDSTYFDHMVTINPKLMTDIYTHTKKKKKKKKTGTIIDRG